jgi:hypothetical protein
MINKDRKKRTARVCHFQRNFFSPGLKLLPLNQVLDYHPPSLRSLFQIDVISTGQPTIKWQQGDPINILVFQLFEKYLLLP